MRWRRWPPPTRSCSGPGSLFTSVMAALTGAGMAEAVENARGRIVSCSTSSPRTRDRRAEGWDHIRAFSRHVGLLRGPGGIVAHRGDLDGARQCERVEIDAEAAAGWGGTCTRRTWPTPTPTGRPTIRSSWGRRSAT
jgi:hypothetical protein